jgi:hypothetical protein
MRAVVRVDVENRKQARQIEAGLAIPLVKALAIVLGVLEGLPTDRARARVLTYLEDWQADPNSCGEPPTDAELMRDGRAR